MRRNIISCIAVFLTISMTITGCGTAEDQPVNAPAGEERITTEQSAGETAAADGATVMETTTNHTETIKETVETTTGQNSEATTKKESATKATQKQTTTQKATQKSTQKATQKVIQKAMQQATTQKQTQKATQPTTKKPAVTQPTTTKKLATTKYPTHAEVMAPISKWYAGYSVYGVPVYRVKSASDKNAFDKAYDKCLKLAYAEYKATPKSNWKKRMDIYPCCILSETYFISKLNQYRKKERNQQIADAKKDVWDDGSPITDADIQQMMKEGQFPMDVTWSQTCEEYAAARAWEVLLFASYDYQGSKWSSANGAEIHVRPGGLEMYAAECWGTGSGVEQWVNSPGHYNTMVGVNGSGVTAALVSAYGPGQASSDWDIDETLKSLSTDGGGCYLEIMSKASANQWIKDGKPMLKADW